MTSLWQLKRFEARISLFKSLDCPFALAAAGMNQRFTRYPPVINHNLGWCNYFIPQLQDGWHNIYIYIYIYIYICTYIHTCTYSHRIQNYGKHTLVYDCDCVWAKKETNRTAAWFHCRLAHLLLGKMVAISQTFSNSFSWMKIFAFWFDFHWRLFLRVQLTIKQYWFR